MTKNFKLYGIAASLYTAKARSYLRKQNIAFTDCAPNAPEFRKHILPAVGRMILPVLQAPDGEIIQDGSDIIDYFEKNNLAKVSAYRENALLQAIGLVFELFGGEGLLRPAMHYRWDYDGQNIYYLKTEFAPLAFGDMTPEKLFEFASARMRQAKSRFGVSNKSRLTIQNSFAEFLELFQAHLTQYPYLLGAQPSIGDYALMGPLYGHLYRDPVPGNIMRTTAPTVSRWVERMNTAEEYWGDYPDEDRDFAGNEIPDTLKKMMVYISQEYLPEISAHIDFANQWLEDHPEIQTGTNGLDNPSDRVIGICRFAWRDLTLETAVNPYRFYLLQRLQDCYDQAAATDQEQIATLLSETGLTALLHQRTTRRIERNNHFEVWGPKLQQ